MESLKFASLKAEQLFCLLLEVYLVYSFANIWEVFNLIIIRVYVSYLY